MLNFLKYIFCFGFFLIINSSCQKNPIEIVDPVVITPTNVFPSDTTAVEYVNYLGKGFDVTFSEFPKYIQLYDEKIIKDMKKAGFTSCRIRIGEGAPDATFFNNLKKQIRDCNKYGIFPIIAYQGAYIEDIAMTDKEARDHLVLWWKNMATQLKDFPNSVSFNILIEISGTYKTNYTSINSFYADVHTAIRTISPKRIVIFPPVNISDPDYLSNLKIPGSVDSFTMAEWHFYAAGPTKKIDNKKYWLNGTTLEERENILEPIRTAVAWMKKTGYKSWVGAWMAGNYNKENEYTIPEQVAFASFMTRALDKEKIPFCINADNKFYDFEKQEWYNIYADGGGIPVRDVIIHPYSVFLYESPYYIGTCKILEEGKYNEQQINALGLAKIGSLMVPFDFEVKLYPEKDFGGNPFILKNTTEDISDKKIKSVEVKFLRSY